MNKIAFSLFVMFLLPGFTAGALAEEVVPEGRMLTLLDGGQFPMATKPVLPELDEPVKPAGDNRIPAYGDLPVLSAELLARTAGMDPAETVRVSFTWPISPRT